MPSTKKWKNIVKVCAALSDVNTKLVMYVKGTIPNGRASNVAQAESKPISNAWKSTIATKLVRLSFSVSNKKFAAQ